MALILVEIQDNRIKKQNSKMYYITFTEPYKFFRRGVSTRLKNNYLFSFFYTTSDYFDLNSKFNFI